MKNSRLKGIIFWITLFIFLFIVFENFNNKDSADAPTKLTYSEFIQQIDQDKIKSVVITNQTITGKTDAGKDFTTYIPWRDPFLTDLLLKHHVSIEAKSPETSFLLQLVLDLAPLLIWLVVIVFLFRNMMGGKGGGAFSFGKSKARLLGEDQVKVTLEDVAGVEEAKEEVGEIVDFLRNPKKYQDIGGKIPHGILMVGPPGTGKTLLARAIGGEAKVPFFSISGSDFVEMFVGVGASRVRDMFAQAKKRAPCIIFIDEIDAVGRHRGNGMGGGHDEREQTLNQMLVEMDGFNENEGVIVIAATNRPDVLDPALLRPGRFDRQVHVNLPDVRGREQIIKVHMRKVSISDDVRPEFLARGTPGFSGADLANLVNEAALFAARKGHKKVTMDDFEKAKDKILMGLERRTLAMTEDEKKLTAYHEAGHAIIGRLVPDHDPVYKITIIPRGRALGVTMYLPENDRVSYSRRRLESQLCSIFGGRLAEELIFGEDAITTGASNDIQKATEIARSMVTKWGLSKKLGPLNYSDDQDQPFAGHSMGMGGKREISEQTAAAIDVEVKALIDRNYERGQVLLKDNVDILHAMSEALMKYETLDRNQVDDLMARRPAREPEGWKDPVPNKTVAADK